MRAPESRMGRPFGTRYSPPGLMFRGPLCGRQTTTRAPVRSQRWSAF